MFRQGTAFGVFLVVTSGAYGEIYIDLRPDHPGVYIPGEVVNVEAWFMDDGTGHPITGEDILFRGYQLDFEDTDSVIGLPPEMDMETDEFGFYAVFPDLPRPSLIIVIEPAPPQFMMTLAPGGEMLIGHLDVTVNGAGWVDVMNPEGNQNLGAWVRFGNGMEKDDPAVNWRAFTGELTGGRLFMAVPEPGGVLLPAIGGLVGLRRRNGR